ncbi:hypothetical protein VTN00DRAFT_6199 [Thermoascus crustaceus]|uniref:uncharacterized protein n=1 Tax=Thermoascus crustaceus TaxID=5088 RepID=UPI0037447C22
MAPTFFKKVVLVASGTFPGYKQADLKAIVEQYGGTFSAKVTDDCTHLVSTQREVENGGTKNKQAANVANCQVVSLDWLLDSEKAKKALPVKNYLFGSAKSTATDGTNGTNGKKNTRASQKDDEADAGKSSKKRSLKTTSDDKAAVNDSAIDQQPPRKKQKDGQKAKSKDLNVPVDEVCPLKDSHRVYISDQGTIWDATLNQTNATANNNKFYRIQLLANGNTYLTWTRWGRVGENGQYAFLGNGGIDDAKRQFEKKFKDKSGLSWNDRQEPPKKGKYTFIERNYKDDSSSEDEDDGKAKIKKKKNTDDTEDEEEVKPIESTLSKPVQDLIAFIFSQQHFLTTMADMSYDAHKLPLGKLSKRTLQAGFQILKDLSELIANPSLAASKHGTTFTAAAEDLSNRYFTTIPHVFGRNRPPVINHGDYIKREVKLLEALTDMEIANEIVKGSKDTDTIHPLDRQFMGLGMQEMTPLDRTSTEFTELENYLLKSYGTTHHMNYQVIDIFRIERQGEQERFMNSKYSKIPNSNRRLLWHGSRSTNYGGILSQGLRIAPPEAPVSGYMFGKGVYFADISTKSAGYCWARNSNNMGLLLLCDVELGDPMLELQCANYNAGEDAEKAGRLATLGLGSTVPQGWKDAGCVHPELKGVLMPDWSVPPRPSGKGGSLLYNEYIVYDVAQIRQRYLLYVRM